MNQQSDNDDKIQQYLLHKPIGQQKAQSLAQTMHKGICTFFEPFKQYFTHYPVEYMKAPEPTKKQREPYQQRYQLSVEKQIQYWNGGAKKSHLESKYLQKLIEEDAADRGLVQNIQNTSLIIGDQFLYASGNQLRTLFLQGLKVNSKQQHNGTNAINNGKNRKTSDTFAQNILQICNYDEQSIIVRCRYWIFKYDIKTGMKKLKQRMNQQITSMSLSKHNKIVVISTYDQNEVKVYTWSLVEDRVDLVNAFECYWPIHSQIPINSRQFIMGLANKIVILDIRSNELENFKRVKQIGDDRFCCISSLVSPSQNFVVSRSKHIDVMDLRNNSQSLLQMRHYCEQAPPTCLLTLNWVQPTIIAYAPYILGSSILININEKNLPNPNKNNHLYKISVQNPILLYDSGKYYEGLHPKSISPTVDNNILKLIHMDSSNGICVQYLKKQQQFNNNIIRLKSANLSSNNFPQDPFKKWIQYKAIQHYLDKRQCQPDSEDSIQSQQSEQDQKLENQLFKRKNSYCSLDRFRQKIKQLSTAQQSRRMNNKQADQVSTYTPTVTVTAAHQDQNLLEILKFTGVSQKGYQKIPIDILDYMQKAWQV